MQVTHLEPNVKYWIAWDIQNSSPNDMKLGVYRQNDNSVSGVGWDEAYRFKSLAESILTLTLPNADIECTLFNTSNHRGRAPRYVVEFSYQNK
jgi:hypothetical protein